MWASQLIGPLCLELRERLSCVKSSTSWLVIKQAVCFSSAMARRLFCFCRYAGFAIDRIHDQFAGGAQCFNSQKTGVVFCMASNGRLAVRSWFNRIVFDGGMLTVAS